MKSQCLADCLQEFNCKCTYIKSLQFLLEGAKDEIYELRMQIPAYKPIPKKKVDE